MARGLETIKMNINVDGEIKEAVVVGKYFAAEYDCNFPQTFEIHEIWVGEDEIVEQLTDEEIEQTIGDVLDIIENRAERDWDAAAKDVEFDDIYKGDIHER